MTHIDTIAQHQGGGADLGLKGDETNWWKLRPVEKRRRYGDALAVYLTGWDGCEMPSEMDVARRCHIPIPQLVAHATYAGWAATRANRNHTVALAATRMKEAVALKIDEAVLEMAEKVAKVTLAAYAEQLEAAARIGRDDTTGRLNDTVADQRETSEGYDVKSELEVRGIILNRATQGFVQLAKGLKELGLVRVPGTTGEGDGRGVLDPSKLAKLTLNFVQVNQSGEPKLVSKSALDVLAEEGIQVEDPGLKGTQGDEATHETKALGGAAPPPPS